MTNISEAKPVNHVKKQTLWWEKTVEYKFILSAKEKFGINILSPLDGDAETIADTIAKIGKKHFIIEFKRRPGDFAAEYNKFALNKRGYLLAKKTFITDPSSKSHFIIAGRRGQSGKLLTLCFMNYFSVPVKLPDNQVFQTGMDKSELITYTEKFTAAKLFGSNTSADDGEGDGCGGGIHKDVLVLAIDEKNNAVVLPLSFFSGPKPSHTPKNGQGSPSSPQTDISNVGPATLSDAEKNDTVNKSSDDKARSSFSARLSDILERHNKKDKKSEVSNPSKTGPKQKR